MNPTHPFRPICMRIVLVVFSSLFLLCATATPAQNQPTAPQSAGKATSQKSKAKLAKPKAKSHPAPLGKTYAGNDAAMQLADDIAHRRDLDPAWVRKAIAQAHHLPSVVRLITPPPVGTVKNWRVYRSRFIDPVRIQGGVKFWRTNQEALQRAEKEFGVPAEIVVAIVGVETVYGQQVGTFSVLDVLATLSLDFPAVHPRAAERRTFFQGELESYLGFTSRAGTDPTSLRGSYAGAMGLPQFMPSSWVKYAVDFDGDGKIDLFKSPADVIGSVANYFKVFQWQTGMPTHYAVNLENAQSSMQTLMAPDILPTFSVARLLELGVGVPPEAQTHTGPLALVELQNAGAAPQYVLGTENFYAITRYNWSSYYAMAVIDLAQEISKAMRAAPL